MAQLRGICLGIQVVGLQGDFTTRFWGVMRRIEHGLFVK